MGSCLQWTTATWYRFLVKQVAARGSINQHSYEWYEMGFFTRWISPGEQIMFCFDIPQTLEDRLQTLFLSPSTTPKLPDIYSLHVIVIDEMVKLFDNSVWSLRDTVRLIELVKLLSCLQRANGLTITSRID